MRKNYLEKIKKKKIYAKATTIAIAFAILETIVVS